MQTLTWFPEYTHPEPSPIAKVSEPDLLDLFNVKASSPRVGMNFLDDAGRKWEYVGIRIPSPGEFFWAHFTAHDDATHQIMQSNCATIADPRGYRRILIRIT